MKFLEKKNKTLEQSTCSGTKKDFNQNLNKKENQQNQLFKNTCLTKKKKKKLHSTITKKDMHSII